MKNQSITQKQILKGKIKLVLNDNNEVEIVRKTMNHHSSFKIPLASLNPESRREKHVNILTMIVAIVFAFIFLLCLFNAFLVRHDASALFPQIAISMSSAAAMLACFVSWLKSSYDFVVFDNINGGASAVLFTDKPNKEEFHSFLETIRTRIIEAQSHRQETVEKTMSQEIVELAKLKGQGLLTEEEFEMAKRAVLGNKSKFGF